MALAVVAAGIANGLVELASRLMLWAALSNGFPVVALTVVLADAANGFEPPVCVASFVLCEGGAGLTCVEGAKGFASAPPKGFALPLTVDASLLMPVVRCLSADTASPNGLSPATDFSRDTLDVTAAAAGAGACADGVAPKGLLAFA